MVWSMVFSGITTLIAALVENFTAGDIATNMATECVLCLLDVQLTLQRYSAPLISWFIDTLDSVYGGGCFVVGWYIVINVRICFASPKDLFACSATLTGPGLDSHRHKHLSHTPSVEHGKRCRMAIQ